MTTAATEVDVVKRGYLRYKTASSGGTLVALQSKGFKEYWFLFRAQKKIKVLEYYGSEKDSNKKNASPRGVVQLHQIRSVGWGDSDRQKQFILYSSDGSHHYLDAPSVYEANEWITALNSVLFAKGPDGGQVIQFNVEVWDSALLNYSGGGILEVRDGQLIVWSVGNHREVVRWKLGHIRSFKAKHNQLHILAGSRSSTGEGIFVFGTQQSVLITHTLETVIEMLAKQKKERQGAPVQHLPPGGSFAPRGQLPGAANLSTQQKLPHPPVPEPYHGALSHSVVPGFSDVPPGHHDLDSQDGAYNRLSYHDDLDDTGSSYSRLGRVSQRPKLHSPQAGAHSSMVQPTSSTADYSSLHPTATNRSSSHEELELDTMGGIYSDISDDAAYNRLGVNPLARTGEANYAEVKNTSPNLQARGARPGSYNALRGVEVGVVDHSQHPPLYSFAEAGDSDEGQYSQLQNATTAPPPPRPAISERHAPPHATSSNPNFFDSHGSVVLDPVSQHYEVSPAASPTMQTKFKHLAREKSYEPEDSAEDFYYELARTKQDDPTATSPVSDTANYQALYSSLNTVTITGASPCPTSDKEEQEPEHNPNLDLRQPARVPPRSGPAEGPPVPPRRSNHPDQFPALNPSHPPLHYASTDGANNKPLPPVAPKPKPRK